ncbi:tetratricopeptide repeat protein [Rhizohabitans arisaemae]|uniref:tetratricopeptide repeat protein n=1 Tax=Rhizohabitans arisaemae TaxID=2720610 RepID=UPI0024B074E0|nr:tetratricopeptide repeat protein [Rhizohabitans arisaemae]
MDLMQVERAAYAAWRRDDWPNAAARLAELVTAEPDGPKSPAWWFDLALAHKFLGDWPKAYQIGKQAAARANRGEEDPAFWNLGIAATVMRDWPTARDAWTGYGITLKPGDGEIVENFGHACVRLQQDDGSEVVWVERICPTRARVISVPVLSGRRFGDIVLHDGEPKGERVVDDTHYPVFNELMIWAASSLPTLVVTIGADDSGDLVKLLTLFHDNGLGAEPHTGLQPICTCCDEGGVEQKRHIESGSQTVLLAGPIEQAAALLREWSSADPDRRRWQDLTLVEEF